MNYEEIKSHFASNLVKLRKSKKMSQNELGNAINYSFKNISKWENEETIPDIDALYKIAKLFDITIDDLISDRDVVKKSNKKHNHFIITLSSVLLPFLVALIVFVILHLFSYKYDYYAFIIGGIVSAITAIVLTSIFYKKNAICASIIYLIVSISILIMFLINFKMFWLVIIVDAVLIAALLLFFSLNFYNSKERHKK